MASFYRDKKYKTVYIEQTVDGERFRRSTGMKVEDDKWAGDKATNNLVMYDGKSVNGVLKTLEMYLTQSIQELTATGGGMAKLYELYDAKELGKRTVKPTGALFMPYLKEYYELLILDKKSTGLSYQTTYRRLEKHFGTANPTFSQLDMDFYEKFNRFLEKDCDLSVKTISSQWKNIKHILKLTYDKKIHTSTDFQNFKRKDEISQNLSLTQEEVDKITTVKLTGHLDKVRDYFLVQCYTGAAFADITKVNLDNVNNNIISFTREKSDEISHIPLHPKVKEILTKYAGTLPEIMSNQKYNDYLKDVCKEAKIKGVFNSRITKGGKKVKSSRQRWEEVTSHTGRRTFATLQVLAGTPINLIMLMTGHKTLDSFDKYIKLRELQGKKELGELSWFK